MNAPFVCKVKVFLVVTGAAWLLAATAGFGQSYFSSLSFYSYAPIPGTQSMNTGNVQTTNLISGSLSGYGPAGSVSVSASAQIGQLQFSASADNDNSPGTNNGFYLWGEYVQGSPVVMFQDTLTPVSGTLPASTHIQFEFVCLYHGFIRPVVNYGPDGVDGAASVNLNTTGYGSEITSVGLGSANQTNYLTRTDWSYPNVPLRMQVAILNYADVWDGDLNPSSSSVATVVSVPVVYVNVLTPGASYVSASGVVYPTLPPPTLEIAASTNDTAVLSWPDYYVNYSLQQNAALNTTNWAANANPVVDTNGFNYVTVNTGSNALFFRLGSQ